MGTIRKTKGEFFYRKDGKTYKFLNQSIIEKKFPNYSEPFQVEDNQVKTFSNGFLDFAALVSIDMKDQIVEELDKDKPYFTADFPFPD